MERWNNGMMPKRKILNVLVNIPAFQYSTIPS